MPLVSIKYHRTVLRGEAEEEEAEDEDEEEDSALERSDCGKMGGMNIDYY